jgi:hypothetical protein
MTEEGIRGSVIRIKHIDVEELGWMDLVHGHLLFDLEECAMLN